MAAWKLPALTNAVDWGFVAVCFAFLGVSMALAVGINWLLDRQEEKRRRP